MSARAVDLALQKPVIPFVPRVKNSSYDKITLDNRINEGTAANPTWVKRSASVYHCSTADKEYILRTIIEFEDVCAPARLRLTSGPAKFAKFRECLGGDIRDTWDLARVGQPETNDGFAAAINAFIAKYLRSTDLALQKSYMDKVNKSQLRMPVTEMASRFTTIANLMRRFPGANAAQPVYSPTDMKEKFFNMMLPEWKLSFAQSGNAINNAEYTYEMLTDFFVTAADVYFAQRSLKRDRNTSGNTDETPRKRYRTDFDPAKPCPYHGNHKWGDCYGNPRGRNYRSSYKLPETLISRVPQNNTPQNYRAAGFAPAPVAAPPQNPMRSGNFQRGPWSPPRRQNGFQNNGFNPGRNPSPHRNGNQQRSPNRNNRDNFYQDNSQYYSNSFDSQDQPPPQYYDAQYADQYAQPYDQPAPYDNYDSYYQQQDQPPADGYDYPGSYSQDQPDTQPTEDQHWLDSFEY